MLTDRQLHLLNVIVEDFVDSGTPIASKKLIDDHHFNVSPATIRAEMKRLEDFGLIEKMHTSSGRVPSEMGYKFYVEALQEEFPYEPNFDVSNSDALDFRRLAQLIARDTRHLSIATTSQIDMKSISQIHLTYLTPTKLVLIIVYENGNVEHQQISWQVRLTRLEIEKMNNFLNANLASINKSNLHQEGYPSIKQLPLTHIKSEIIKKATTNTNAVFFEGREYLYEIMDSDNLEAIREMLKLIDSRTLPDLIESKQSNQIEVILGQEISENLQGISIVTTPIHMHNMNGNISIIGSTQMSYRDIFNKLSNLHRMFKED